MLTPLLKLLKRSKQKKVNTKQDMPNPMMDLQEQAIRRNLQTNLDILKKMYNSPDNKDVKFRDIHVKGVNKQVTVLFISTITDIKTIEMHVLKPLLSNNDGNTTIQDLISVQNIKKVESIRDILQEVNNGNVAVLVENQSEAYIAECSNIQARSIGIAEDEVLLKGPKEAFVEKAFTNISLIRKKIKNESLVVDSVVVSKRSKNEVFILYQKDIANEHLVNDIKYRLKKLDTNAIQNLGILEQFIEERKTSIFPTCLYTERPDRAASFIEDGNIVLLMDNSPASLVLPATFWTFFHTPEEHYLRFPYGNITRLLRAFALFTTLFTSATYIAITNYHAEMIPADLLLAIASARERVPFPAIVEIIIMEIAFELIREAGLRVPSPIGPTIGIVGAIILGQAAVEANIISPIIIIIVSLGGLSSFAISDVSLNFAIRILRFLFILSAGFFGIYGMTSLFIIGLLYLVSLKSFGVPYFSPMTPKYRSSEDTVFRKLLQNEKWRPGYLRPNDMKKR
ncbi:MAG TPA: spore germination protein [Bacillus sp. (in: firmicutes)]|nr:spore germination protein [Bacillus sp. (in: firmicutes)]